MKKSGLIGGLLTALILVVCLVGAVMCLERVPAGYVGVVYNMNGGVDGEILSQGWHIVEANAKAEALKIAAEAEAEANREIAASLTPELIEKIKMEQWDGKYPETFVSGGASSIIVN